MNELIQRYIDGELSEEEARTLRETVARDPSVDAELRAWERILSDGADAETGAPSPEFTDHVMRAVTGRRATLGLRVSRPFRVSWATGLAWAATLVVTFALGALSTRVGDRMPVGPVETRKAGTQGVPGQDVAPAVDPPQGELRVVRLVYLPRDPAVRKVHVAGTFNDWDARGIALRQKGGVWTAVLVLPRGTYEYMFVEDDTRWVTDPLALQTRDDGFGNRNAVLDLTL